MAKSNIEKLNELSKPCQTDWLKIAEGLEQNEAWLKKSAEIAANVLYFLRKNGMSKQTLAEKMGVKPQFISRIIKGNTNLTLETITKLEEALGQPLIDICDNTELIVTKSQISIFGEKWAPIIKSINSTYLNKELSYQDTPNFAFS